MTRGQELLYVELKSGYSDDGPAWIGFGVFSRSGTTIYFDGKVLKRGTGISGNRYDLRTGEEYWVSGVKKRGSNRHPFGLGAISIDRSAVAEYLRLTGMMRLPDRLFNVVELDNEPKKAFAYEMENRTPAPRFDHSLRFKALSDLSSEQLQTLLAYYEGLDMNALPKKSRKGWITSLDDVQRELESRKAKSEM
jgi:hypothetical protein